MEFKYLGTEITSNGALQPEVQHRAHKAARISGRLNDTAWLDKYLRLELTNHLLDQFLRILSRHESILVKQNNY
jgi:hypothetical protein